jgi:hypothetical protein
LSGRRLPCSRQALLLEPCTFRAFSFATCGRLSFGLEVGDLGALGVLARSHLARGRLLARGLPRDLPAFSFQTFSLSPLGRATGGLLALGEHPRVLDPFGLLPRRRLPCSLLTFCLLPRSFRSPGFLAGRRLPHNLLPCSNLALGLPPRVLLELSVLRRHRRLHLLIGTIERGKFNDPRR